MAGSSVLDSMIDLYHHTNFVVINWNIFLEAINLLRQSGSFDRASVFDTLDQTTNTYSIVFRGSNHRFSISYRLCEKKKVLNSSPQEWAPLSYLSETNRTKQSHDYRTTTKSNSCTDIPRDILFSPQLFHRHCVHPRGYQARTRRDETSMRGKI